MNTEQQGCTNPERQVGQTTEFGTAGSDICGSSIRNGLHVSLLAPRILRWIPHFWKTYEPLFLWWHWGAGCLVGVATVPAGCKWDRSCSHFRATRRFFLYLFQSVYIGCGTHQACNTRGTWGGAWSWPLTCIQWGCTFNFRSTFMAWTGMGSTFLVALWTSMFSVQVVLRRVC